jgi:NADPH:quinone reductase-like Zn-dependent oxidoreductase
VKANRIHRFGGPEVIALEETAIPIPAAGEVLVRVHAAGVGPWDALIRSGASALDQPLPLTLGADLAGTIEAVGGDVPFAFHEAIYGVTNARFVGAYAEYALADAGRIARIPERLSMIEAAGIPVVAVTAMQMLERAAVSVGTRVLIHGAAGAVGSVAVQLAAERGANVTGTVIGDDDDLRERGASTVIDVRTTRFEDVVDEVDAVLDLVGGDVQRRSFDLLTEGGRLVSAVTRPEAELAARYSVDASWLLVDVTSRALADVGVALARGHLSVRIGTVLSLGEAREAHEMLADTRPRARGKIVLRTGS